MIRINFRRDTQTKVSRRRPKVPLNTGIVLMSAAIFLILALLIFLLVRPLFSGEAESEIGKQSKQSLVTGAKR